MKNPAPGKKPVYAALFLDAASKARLLAALPPVHPNVYAEHMTIVFGPDPAALAGLPMGHTLACAVVGYAEDAQGQAVAVHTTLPVAKAIPHITLSTAAGVSPKYSNELLAAGFSPLSVSIRLTGVVDTFPR